MDESIPDGGDMKLRPTEYFRRQFYASFWFEKDAARAVKELGEENVLFETDFPHPTCLYPNVREHVEASLEGLSEQAKRKVLYENAARVYQLPSPA
jgi:predicted TIM-barrel fold metal-dependent hydrolase